MLDFIEPINLIRYLIVWRVTDTLVRMPPCLSTALSDALGAIILERLPTREARAWRKTRAAWETAQNPRAASDSGWMTPPQVDAPWPINAVLFPYPSKRVYGVDEVIVWELKLLGPHADHELFLELFLPAMEYLGTTTEKHWRKRQSLWGHFDVQAVYAARGSQWEPVVHDTKLDLQARVSPVQWREGLTFEKNIRRAYRQLTWITPFDLGTMPGGDDSQRVATETLAKSSVSRRSRKSRRRRQRQIATAEIPTFNGILNALIERVTPFLPGKKPTVEQVWALVQSEDVWALLSFEEAALSTPEPELAAVTEPPPLQSQTVPIRVPKNVALIPPPKGWPGQWIGSQSFATPIPERLLPYLELASILHIGQQTHFGCGTFRLD